MAATETMTEAERTERELIESDIEGFLDQHAAKELLRFVTVGSVDDGKSTLIGRLLHDTKGVYDDQLKDATRTSETGETAIDFARITDGLRAEREQGITIDVAYRYFSTPRRKFIIADTPGHVQYTRNMATGASTANVGIILIDARLGVLEQSRRHGFIASLLGIPHLLVAVNKMDLVDYGQGRFDELVAEFKAFCDEQLSFTSVTFVPISALMGVNVVEEGRETKTPWYDGPTVLQYLETVEVSQDRNQVDFRFPVQYVIRPNLDYRGFAAQIPSGHIRKGDEVMVLPSRQKSRVKAIDTYDGELDEAFPPLSVVLRLEDEIDCSRGDMLVKPDNVPHVGQHFEAMVVWMSETPLDTDKSYVIKHTTRYERVNVDEVEWEMDLSTIEHRDTDGLQLNDIGKVRFTSHRNLYFDAYRRNRHTGAFVIIDSLTNGTVGAGMILEPESAAGVSAGIDLGAETQVSVRERASRLGQQGLVVWVTGRPASGRSSLAFALERRLFDLGLTPVVLDDGDGRYDASALLATSKHAADVARRMADAGLVTIAAVPSATIPEREAAAKLIGNERFMLVHVDTPEEVAAARDPQNRYEGGTMAYEAPRDAAVTVSMEGAVEDAVKAVVDALQQRGVVP